MNTKKVIMDHNMNDNKIELFSTGDGDIQLEVNLTDDTVWLTQKQMAELFAKERSVVTKHINSIFREFELDKNSNVQKMHIPNSDKPASFYSLDVIISVGYRVKSKRGTQFRQWANSVLKNYLIEGFAINQKRLAEKEMEIKTLKTGIQILSTTLKEHINNIDEAKELSVLLDQFEKGLTLLDDYDHESLDTNGKNTKKAKYIDYEQFQSVISAMRSEFSSDIFGQEKDNSFKSAINQIYQTFENNDLYASLEEKAATLLYLIIKNHAFIDGNKRIAATCFLYFLEQNNLNPIDHISNDALATLTLFIAASKPDDMKVVISLVISLLNRQ